MRLSSPHNPRQRFGQCHEPRSRTVDSATVLRLCTRELFSLGNPPWLKECPTRKAREGNDGQGVQVCEPLLSPSDTASREAANGKFEDSLAVKVHVFAPRKHRLPGTRCPLDHSDGWGARKDSIKQSARTCVGAVGTFDTIAVVIFGLVDGVLNSGRR